LIDLLVPHSFPTRRSSDLQQAIRQAAIMTDEESKRVVFSFAKKKLTLQARGAEAGRSKVEMPLEYDGKTVEISFDPKFVLEMLRSEEHTSELQSPCNLVCR